MIDLSSVDFCGHLGIFVRRMHYNTHNNPRPTLGKRDVFANMRDYINLKVLIVWRNVSTFGVKKYFHVISHCVTW